jgi:hypothetical protein
MFVYTVDRKSTFPPKAYQLISITSAFQSLLVCETEKKKFLLGRLCHHAPFLVTLLSPVIVCFLLSFCWHLDRYQQSFYSGKVQCILQSFILFRQKTLMLYIVAQKIFVNVTGSGEYPGEKPSHRCPRLALLIPYTPLLSNSDW